MDQLSLIYQSVSKSICSTVSASFSLACGTAFFVFLFDIGVQMLRRACRGGEKEAGAIAHIFRQGIWLSLLAGYISMVLFRTWIARPRWEKPLEKIFGGWGLYNEKGVFTTEAIENGLLLLPFTWLLGMLLKKRWRDRPAAFLLGRLTLGGFLMSLVIETVQVMWNRGTLQLSDLFYNTLGGMLGALLFLLCRKIGEAFWGA